MYANAALCCNLITKQEMHMSQVWCLLSCLSCATALNIFMAFLHRLILMEAVEVHQNIAVNSFRQAFSSNYLSVLPTSTAVCHRLRLRTFCSFTKLQKKKRILRLQGLKRNLSRCMKQINMVHRWLNEMLLTWLGGKRTRIEHSCLNGWFFCLYL